MLQAPKPVRVPDLLEKKQRGEKIAVLTAYDATIARLLDCAGVDVILVGDSLGMVIMGHKTTLEVTLDMMVHHTRAVVNGTRHALVVADMPFLTFQTGIDDAVRNAGRLIQEGGAAAVLAAIAFYGGQRFQPTQRESNHICMVGRSVLLDEELTKLLTIFYRIAYCPTLGGERAGSDGITTGKEDGSLFILRPWILTRHAFGLVAVHQYNQVAIPVLGYIDSVWDAVERSS